MKNLNRIFFILPCCFFFSTINVVHSFSDVSLDSLGHQLQQIIDEGNFQKANTFGQQILEKFAKDSMQNATALAFVYIQMGRNNYNLVKYIAANKYYKTAKSLYQKNNNNLGVADAWHGLGNVAYYNKDVNTCLDYYKKAFISFNRQPKEDYINHPTYYSDRAYVVMQLGDFKAAEKDYKKALQLRKKYFPNNYAKLGDVYNSVGSLYKFKNDLFVALQYFNKAIEFFKQAYTSSEHPNIAIAYASKGVTLADIGDHATSLVYIKQAINFLEKNESFKIHPEFLKMKITLAENLKVKGDYQKAIEVSKEVIEIARMYNYYEPLIQSLNLQALCFLDQNRLIKAKAGFEEVLELIAGTYGLQSYHASNVKDNLGHVYLFLNQYDKALFYYQQALEINEKVWGSPSIPVTNSYNNIATVYSKTGQLEKALSLFGQVDGVFKYEEGNFEKITYTKEFLYIKFNQAEVLLDTYRAKKQVSFLEEAFKNYIILTDYMDYLKHHFKELDTREVLNEDNYIVYERAILSAYLLYEETKETRYVEKAYSLAEKSKNFVLLEALKANQNSFMAALPDSLAVYSAGINYYERQIFMLQQKSSSEKTETIKALQNRLFHLKNRHQTLIATLEKQYPKYFELKKQTNPPNLRAVQDELLEADQALVEYFVGDTSIFVFVISQNRTDFYSIEKDFPLEDIVKNMRTAIYAWTSNLRQPPEENRAMYIETANLLYQKLLQPLGELPEKLLIVPDGCLGVLPFDALLTAPPEFPAQYHSYPYCLKKHQIHYAYSATLQKEMKDKQHQKKSKDWLAFAPKYKGKLQTSMRSVNFEDLKNGLPPLLYAKDEVKNIQIITKGKCFVDKEATEQQFKDLAEDYRFLHLSMHGILNPLDSDYSLLAFYQLEDDIENEWLFVKELYNYQLNADMVVMSACDMGVGDIQRGEGIISMARGFSYAGAKSIITTLWGVPDQKTQELMELFYQNLDIGMTKDEALRKAKLDLIQATDELLTAHPFYWASFISIGDASSVQFQPKGQSWRIWGLGGLLFFIFIGFFLKKH